MSELDYVREKNQPLFDERMIDKLRDRYGLGRAAAHWNGCYLVHPCCALQLALDDIERLRKCLHKIASWGEGETVTGSFDNPADAQRARLALSRQEEE